MTDSTSYNIDGEAWRRALLAIKRDILDAEPVEALREIDALMDALDAAATGEQGSRTPLPYPQKQKQKRRLSRNASTFYSEVKNI